MEAHVVDNAGESRFEVVADGRRVGFLAYERSGDTLALTEIETDPDQAGKGLGLTLVRGALDAAAAAGLSVRPVSAFVRDFVERHPVYLDLVPPDARTEFGLPPA
jgi:predicted GNAT family acetyltransferase